MPELPATAASRAVFLSYAREDHAAARRIADALRGFGVEVWFDQSELRGGDAWDQKIRKQIKECALFLPVVSQHTQERGEGYFRLEWKLAVERTHQMAEGIPFLTPVAIDQAHEADALVPPEFMRVHWTRLPDGTPTPQFLEQVKRLLDSPRKSTATRKAESAGSQFSVAPIPPGASAAPTPFAPVARPATPAPAKPNVSLWFNLALGAVTLALVAYIVRRPTAQEMPSALAPAKPVAEAKAAAPAPSTNHPSPAAAAAASVAVLAFANLSDDKANEYFSDGISEELLNVLCKVPGLKVTARTSSFHFKGKDTPIPEIAQQLGVAYVVEGSVRKAGDKVRITAQLIKAADGFHVWSDTFTRDLKDVFAVQDEIAGLIAKNLSLKLGVGAVAGAAAVNPEAFRLYLEGRKEWNRRSLAGHQRAEVLLNRAIELEPGFARAHAALADVWNFLESATLKLGAYRLRNAPELARIFAKSDQALALDPNCAEAYAARSHTLQFAWRLDEDVAALRRAVELNPNYATARQWLGGILLTLGYVDEAAREYQRAAELDPLSHRILDNYSDALAAAGRLDEAWAVLGRARTLNPDGAQILCKQAMLLARMGRRDEAIAAARALVANDAADEFDYRVQAAIDVLVTFGKRAEAEKLLPKIKAGGPERVGALLSLGRTSEGFASLDDMDTGFCDTIRMDPKFAKVYAEPEFAAWLKKVGLADAQRRLEAWRQAHPPEKPEAKN